MKSSSAPPLRDIVLLGGGHAHVQVLKAFGMRPEPGLRITIVAREPHSPYTGMLPGYVEGVYDWDDIHIDLVQLAAFAGARFIAAEATGIDLPAQRLVFDNRPMLHYDVLSINTGGVPGERFASEFVTPVKPIGRFLPVWRRLTESGRPPEELAIVGAGPGGVELALAIVHRYKETRCTLIDAGTEALKDLAPGARRRLLATLRADGVALVTGFRVCDVRDGQLADEGGSTIAAKHVLWVTGVEAPAWPAAAGLDADPDGFVSVNDGLQSTSHPEVFAVGDVAAVIGQPRPKSGVYAVRQGPLLSANLRRFATDRPLRRFRAQRHAMAIIGLGTGKAVASRGPFSLAGRPIWSVKQWIDRRFMRKFSKLPSKPIEEPKVSRGLRDDLPTPVRCAGCGAKLGADSLRAVLRRLDVPASPAVVQSIGDDAAIVRVGAGDLAVSCDGFRAMIDDGYRFGRISAHHALNDLYAMGARPSFALAIATVPLMADAMMEEDLFQILSGALAVFRAAGVDLVGGHTAEGAELGLAFSVAGTVPARALTKAGLVVGQALVLTGAVGTGTLLAGAMQGQVRAEDLLAAVDAMDSSNAEAAEVLRDHGATGCTDVTGFGLAGHLSEMTRASRTGARILAGDVPRLAGAGETISSGIVSSLQANNERALEDFTIKGGAPNEIAVRLLADPQTAGGLLAGIPADAAAGCVGKLRRRGYAAAAIIGKVTDSALEIVL